MRTYLDAMDEAPYIGGAADDRRPAACWPRCAPKMLGFGQHAEGAHPYNVPPEHTAHARQILGPGPLLCPEQAVAARDRSRRRRGRRAGRTAIYCSLPNYVNNLRRFGFEEDDFADGGSDRLIDAMVAWGTIDQIVERVQGPLRCRRRPRVHPGDRCRSRAVPVAEWRQLAPALAELGATVKAAR